MIAFEFQLARAAVRNMLRRPTRRALWIVVFAAASVAAVVDIATAGSAQRDLGALRITPFFVACSVAVIFAIAALAGAMTPRPYGTRAADAIWWRYAGVSHDRAIRTTALILVGRVPLTFGALALPIGATFALAAPEDGRMIALFTVAAIVTATAARALALACTYPREALRAGQRRRTPAKMAGRPHTAVPAGLAAARWMLAVRRGEPVVPFAMMFVGLASGIVLAQAAVHINGQLDSLAAVIGPAAYFLGGALRRDTGIEELQSPWWRIALGVRPRAIGAWAIAAALGPMGWLIGTDLGLAVSLGTPFIGVLAIPTIALSVPVQKLLCLAVDVAFANPLDRRGPATFVRVALVALTATMIVILAWSVAGFGIVAMLLVADLALVSTALITMRWASARLAA